MTVTRKEATLFTKLSVYHSMSLSTVLWFTVSYKRLGIWDTVTVLSTTGISTSPRPHYVSGHSSYYSLISTVTLTRCSYISEEGEIVDIFLLTKRSATSSGSIIWTLPTPSGISMSSYCFDTTIGPFHRQEEKRLCYRFFSYWSSCYTNSWDTSSSLRASDDTWIDRWDRPRITFS